MTVTEIDYLSKAIMEVPKTFGWTGFTDWAVQVQITVRTFPGMQGLWGAHYGKQHWNVCRVRASG